jgi:hypothetical protein
MVKMVANLLRLGDGLLDRVKLLGEFQAGSAAAQMPLGA